MYCLTETWLHEKISSPELGFTNYDIYRLDRENIIGGGVLISIRKLFHSKLLKLKNKNIEQIAILAKLKTTKIIIVCAYIPPQASVDVYCKHCDEIESLKMKYPDAKLIIFGDFNLPNVNWAQPTESSNPISAKAQLIIDTINFINLKQLNHVKNINDRILDLVISNINNSNVSESQESIVSIDSHHPPLQAIIYLAPIELLTPQSPIHAPNYKKADYKQVRLYLSSLNWSPIFMSTNVEEATNVFNSILYNTIENCIPTSIVKRNDCYPKWVSTELKKLIQCKKIAHINYKSNNSIDCYKIFSDLRNKCKSLSKKCYSDYITDVEQTIKSNPKHFWNYVKSLKDNNGCPRSMYSGRKHADNDQEIVDLFADYFSSVYEHNNDNVTLPEFKYTNVTDISTCHISLDDVNKKIRSLDCNKGSGSDKIPPVFIKECSQFIAAPLQHIFNLSLQTGIFPGPWKLNHLTPVFKSGDKNCVLNYRPICILSTIPKMFESIVLDKIAVKFRHIITPEQHGFVTGRSTTTNLLLYEHYIYEAFTSRAQVDSIYTDFSKAFDKVNIDILLAKLQALGIHGSFLKWLNSYLCNRELMVKLNNKFSYKFKVTSGVPQGSHLGPLLFILFINDLSLCFDDVKFILFADDLKLFKIIKSLNDALILQQNLDRLASWCEINKLFLNVKKCFHMCFYRSRIPISTSYLINNNEIALVPFIKDLGVIFDRKLTFDRHCETISNKAMQILGFVIRNTRTFQNIESIKLLYCSLVRSQLEYASPVWSPIYTCNLHRLERVQRKFLRYVQFKLRQPVIEIRYNALMSDLNLPLLSTRRTINDILILFKLLNNLIDCPQMLSVINIRVPVKSTRLHHLFHSDNHSTNYSYHSPLVRFHRTANTYTDLFDIFKTSPSCIKAKITSYLCN